VGRPRRLSTFCTNTTLFIAEAEHFVVSHVQKVIPQGAQDWWHEYRKAQKGAEKEVVSNSDVADGVEMAGWGVREAEERNQAEASKSTRRRDATR